MEAASIDAPDARPDQRLEARGLYWKGYTVAEIARLLALAYGTVDAWKRRDGWDDAPIVTRLEQSAERRLMVLIDKPDKTDRDFQEMEHIGRLLERTARIEKYQATAKESDLKPESKRGPKPKRQDQKNVLTSEQVQKLVEAFDKGLFGYQRRWRDAKDKYRVRNILKSRQIGATWYFAREALIDAITTGDNQIFLSASKAQAHVFREYIVQFVQAVTGVVLKGTPITLWNGATLYFLGTNSKTAQGYHGHVYLDEYAWITKFREFKKVASGMATHKKWRITYFSTPSAVGHQAYAFWTGAEWLKGKPANENKPFDVSHIALRRGAVCPDGSWRNMVTVHDAEEEGCDLFDINQLLQEYNDHDFANLYRCEWVDDALSFFTFFELTRCMVDSWEVWEADFAPLAERPYGDRPVWIGYDPSRSRDNASVVVIAPPGPGQTKYRVLEKLTFTGADFNAQAEAIKSLCRRYNVQHIGIDVTGIGQGVYEMVRGFYPAAQAITYNVETKGRMVLKAKHLISRRLLEWDSGATDIVSAFLSIRQAPTASGRQMTFTASRSEETGHADAAWAIMHAIDKVHFAEFDTSDGGQPAHRNIVELC